MYKYICSRCNKGDPVIPEPEQPTTTTTSTTTEPQPGAAPTLLTHMGLLAASALLLTLVRLHLQ